MSLRPDFRPLGKTRPITIQFDGLARVDGSARFGFGMVSQINSCLFRLYLVLFLTTPRGDFVY